MIVLTKISEEQYQTPALKIPIGNDLTNFMESVHDTQLFLYLSKFAN
ncbi:hypothetical protein protein [Bacillus cereus G9241]|nr:hypothetical protein protein [Bacillus cereus G9241]